MNWILDQMARAREARKNLKYVNETQETLQMRHIFRRADELFGPTVLPGD